MQNYNLIQPASSHASQIAKMLARAFHDDALYAFVLPEDSKRAEVLLWLFDRVMCYSFLYGRVYATPELDGVACWLPPGQTELTLGRIVRSGLVAAPLKMGLPAYRRFDAYSSYVDKLHAQYAPQPHWYLWVLAVAPSSQGQGIGSRLIQPILEQTHAESIACYLETEAESNIRFYKKHGFRVVEEGAVPGTGLKVWAMMRDGADA